MRLRLTVLAVCLPVLLAACGGNSSPTTASAATAQVAQQTKVIVLAGNLAFGNVNFGSTSTLPLTIGNSGAVTLNFTSISATGGTASKDVFVSPQVGVVPPGGSVTVTVGFTPTVAEVYSTTLFVASDATSGNGGINLIGTGINNTNTPLFTQSGVGPAVFTLPPTVTNLHVVATYLGVSENFVVYLGPAGSACGTLGASGCALPVNTILGTHVGSVPEFDTTFPTAGLTLLTVLLSEGVSWTITEVR